MAHFPRALIHLKGGKIGINSKFGKLASWSWIKKLTIGDYVYIGPDARFYARGGINIGDGTIIGPRLTVYSSNHNFISNKYVPYDNDLPSNHPVHIGCACWIGDSCIILPGTHIGDHCLIGAGSVVRGVIPEGSLVMGNPAVIIKNYPISVIESKRELLKQQKYYMK